jgi:hypothetical protein
MHTAGSLSRSAAALLQQANFANAEAGAQGGALPRFESGRSERIGSERHRHAHSTGSPAPQPRLEAAGLEALRQRRVARTLFDLRGREGRRKRHAK